VLVSYALWPQAALWAAAALALPLLVDALRRADGSAPVGQHLYWAGATAMIWAARQMAVPLADGASLQYIGAAWLALLLGYPRAVVSMAIVFAAEALGPASATPPGTATQWLLQGVLPAWLSCRVATECRQRLGPNPFVFLLGAGFLGLFTCSAASVLAVAGAGWLLADPAPGALWDTHVPYALLLAGGEAWLEGMITTLLVVFFPSAVRLFDERFYLGSGARR
jgi:uncharacterized membrane protein